MKKENNLAVLGSHLRAARESHGWSIRELCRRSELGFGTIAELEAGKIEHPNPRHLQRLATALKLNEADLFGLADLLPEGTLPTVSGLLHTKYRELPNEAVAAIDSFIDYTLKTHGIAESGANAKENTNTT